MREPFSKDSGTEIMEHLGGNVYASMSNLESGVRIGLFMYEGGEVIPVGAGFKIHQSEWSSFVNILGDLANEIMLFNISPCKYTKEHNIVVANGEMCAECSPFGGCVI